MQAPLVILVLGRMADAPTESVETAQQLGTVRFACPGAALTRSAQTRTSSVQNHTEL